MKRRRRKNPGWASEHPWMTFFLASSAISTVGWIAYYIVDAKSASASGALPAGQASITLPDGQVVTGTISS